MYKKFLIFSLLTSLIKANEYNFDLLDDVFDLDLEQLQHIKVISASKISQNLNTTPAKMIVVTKE